MSLKFIKWVAKTIAAGAAVLFSVGFVISFAPWVFVVLIATTFCLAIGFIVTTIAPDILGWKKWDVFRSPWDQ